MKMYEYTLTLNSEQARETLKAVELLMRLKLNQAFTFSDSVVGWDTKDWKGIHTATKKVEEALSILFKDREPEKWKDDEWYRLYNLYQVIRKAIHDAEHPETPGVDSYDPIKFTDEPLPKIRWEEHE